MQIYLRFFLFTAAKYYDLLIEEDDPYYLLQFKGKSPFLNLLVFRGEEEESRKVRAYTLSSAI